MRLLFEPAVDHDKILENLVALEGRVSETEGRIAQFRDVVASKEACGENAAFAKAMLRECEAVLVMPSRFTRGCSGCSESFESSRKKGVRDVRATSRSSQIGCVLLQSGRHDR